MDWAFDWLNKNAPSIWCALTNPIAEYTLIVMGVILSGRGLYELWKFKHRQPPTDPPVVPQPLIGTTITATGGAGSNNPTVAVGDVGAGSTVNTAGRDIIQQHFYASTAPIDSQPAPLGATSAKSTDLHFSTSGLGNNSVDTGLSRSKITLERFGISYKSTEPPRTIDVGGKSVTLSFADRYLIINDHGEVVQLDGTITGQPAQQPTPEPIVYPGIYRLSSNGSEEELEVTNIGPPAYSITVEQLIIGGWVASFTRPEPRIGSGSYLVSLSRGQEHRMNGLYDILTEWWQDQGRPQGLTLPLIIRFANSEGRSSRCVCEVLRNPNLTNSLGIEIRRLRQERI